ncbi:Cof-type HAD-IIB family hydrolase [Marinicrinis sediminis]|uniref:Cof-type HAD-IIB family hydrolase n=1 Tax=Marinicrinis sediminis TaxID=1652465 RepID=A0ABW5RF14_9BACL
MYKMITIDIDDTLINDQKEVSEGTKLALQAAVDKGVIVTLATGRMFASAKQIAKQLDLNVPIITYQGSLIKNCLDETVLYERSVPSEAVAKLFAFARDKGLHLQAYYQDELYAAEVNDKLLAYCELSNVPYKIESDFEKLCMMPMTKLIIIDEPALLDEIAPQLREILGDEVHVTKSKPNFLEFIHREGTKGSAVAFLAERYQCELSEVIAVGDSWNDHDMIETAGMGVAMENAVPALKEIANFITHSNNDEGVKHVIETFILNAEQPVK